jgi:hypothetical protein
MAVADDEENMSQLLLQLLPFPRPLLLLGLLKTLLREAGVVLVLSSLPGLGMNVDQRRLFSEPFMLRDGK